MSLLPRTTLHSDSEQLYNKYFVKIFSPLCVDVFPELFWIFPYLDILWYMTKDSEVNLKNCLLIQTCSTSSLKHNVVDLVGRVLASYSGGPWIKSQERRNFFYRNKTSEYTKIYHEQLTSEHFLPYKHRPSTLPDISRNISRLLRQCSTGLNNKQKTLQPVCWQMPQIKEIFFVRRKSS
jgi:hypothetical protein